MIENLIENLNHYKSVIEKITDNDFSKEIPVLSNGTIGQHIRHVLEFYTGLFYGIESGIVCYDNRKRDLLLETDKNYAFQTINKVIQQINAIDEDLPIILQSSVSNKKNSFIKVNTSIYRELVYGFDHSVHHQALIKIGMQALNRDLLFDNFGVAPSTIKHKKACAQ